MFRLKYRKSRNVPDEDEDGYKYVLLVRTRELWVVAWCCIASSLASRCPTT